MRWILLMTLGAGLPLHATLVVSGGSLVIQDNSLLDVGDSVVRDGATVKMSDTAELLINDGLVIDAGGQLIGCGLIAADVIINNGEIIANCGSTMTLAASVTNNGLIRAVNDTALSADSGFFLNNGTLDLITGSGDAPANLTGSGAFFSASLLPGFTVSLDAALDQAEVSIQTNTYHTYELETSTTLMPDSWTVADTFIGDGSLLTWTVTGVGSRLFYRINIIE